MAESHKRKTHFSLLWSEGVWSSWIGFGWTIYGVLAAIKTEVLSAKQQEEWQLVNMTGSLFSISLSWWAAIAAAIIAFWIFEASFRLQRKGIEELIVLRAENAELAAYARAIDAPVSQGAISSVTITNPIMTNPTFNFNQPYSQPNPSSAANPPKQDVSSPSPSAASTGAVKDEKR